MEVIRLVKIGFDNLENRNARYEEEIGIFGPSSDGGSAYAAVQQWIAQQPPVKLYTGYDHAIYPQWRLETKYLK